MQEFNKNTLISGYIQKLLYDTYVPSISVVTSKEYAPDDSDFICGNAVYHKSGSDVKFIRSYTFGERLINQSSNFVSNNFVYTSELHEALGRYLRFYRDYYDIDLLPFYNVCSNKFATNVTLPITGSNTCSPYDSSVKTLVFPVKYNTMYRIKVNSNSIVKPIVQAGFYNGVTLMNLSKDTFPIVDNIEAFHIEPIDASDHAERYLHLFVQLPLDSIVSSNIVVIDEGPINRSVTDIEGSLPTYFVNQPLVINNSLLSKNYGKQVPFSDRLVEFLLGNAITGPTSNPHDIARVRRHIQSLEGSPELDEYTGHFTDDLHRVIYNIYRDSDTVDFSGYVDKDIEWALYREHNYDEGGRR